jgi:hypothetical protein
MDDSHEVLRSSNAGWRQATLSGSHSVEHIDLWCDCAMVVHEEIRVPSVACVATWTTEVASQTASHRVDTHTLESLIDTAWIFTS